MNEGSRAPIIIGIVAAAAIGGLLWWQKHRTPAPAVAVSAPAVAPAAPSIAPAVPPPTPPAEPAIRHPLAAPAAFEKSALPPLDQADAYVENLLFDLLGRKAVLSFLGVDDFVRHFVVTVSNLGTDHAPSQMWPVNRTEGHFIDGAANAARYAAFVRFADGIDTGKAVALYRRLYPLFQQAYEDLGFPGKYFNDRLIEVIDNLLATPDIVRPIKVKLWRFRVRSAARATTARSPGKTAAHTACTSSRIRRSRAGRPGRRSSCAWTATRPRG